MTGVEGQLASFIGKVLLQLMEKGIVCAIRRNAESSSIPMKGDVDILVWPKNVQGIINVLSCNCSIIRVKMSYGGMKVWVEVNRGIMKELDFIWRVSKLGVVLIDTDEVADMLSDKIFEEGMPSLAPKAIGKLIFMEKKKIADYERYSKELKSAGLQGLNAFKRAMRLFDRVAKRPFNTGTSVARFILIRILRLIYPVGVSVHCPRRELIVSSSLLNYLFERRIYARDFFLSVFLLRNVRGGLVMVNKKNADVVLTDGISRETAEKLIIDFLIKARCEIPKLVWSLA